MTVTMHDCTSWNVHRATLIEHAHEVDGVGFIGGRGQRLDAMIERTYREEAGQLGCDLAGCLASLPAPAAQEVLEALKPILGHAAGARHDMHSAVRSEPALAHDDLIVHAGIVDDEDPEEVPDAPVSSDPVDEPKRGRGRRQDDAAAALTDLRDDATGEVLIPGGVDGAGGNGA